MATFKVGYVKGKYKKGEYIGKWGSGYYWPHIGQTGFDWFLLYMIGCKRTRFAGRNTLKKGQIIIGNSSGHTYVIIDSNQRIAEANDAWSDSICYGRNYVNYDPYYVYTLPWTEDEIDAFLYNMKQIADDNSYYYSHNNSLGNYNYYNAKGLDCCTYISLCIYITLGWEWNNQRYQNCNGWWYVKDGYVDFTYNGLASNKYGVWVIKNGQVDFGAKGFYEGTIKLKYGYWWVEGGQVQTDMYDIIKDPYDGNWRYVKGGCFTEYTGIASNKNGLWRLEKGIVSFTDGEYDVKIKVIGGHVANKPDEI